MHPTPPDPDHFGIALTTLPTEAQALALAQAIVTQGLGACVQITPLRSVYRWQGQVCQEAEWQLSIKLPRAGFEALARFIRSQHPYQVPELLMLPLVAAAPDYLAWVAGQAPDPTP